MSETDTVRGEATTDVALEPLFYPANTLTRDAPIRWLRLGLNDLRQAPRLSLGYGAVVVGFLYLMTGLAWDAGNTLALFTLSIGSVLIGPVLAFGLYSISRQIEQGQTPRFGYCIRESQNHLRNELLFALVLLIILLVWARAASMVHIFFPLSEEQTWQAWLQFLAVGSAIGSVFAAIVFTASAFSLPMMLDRSTDAITGALTSVNAVLRNKGVMLIWAGLILGLMAVGVATALVGLVFILPLIGHATWHAYRETIQPAQSPAAAASTELGSV